MNKVLRTILWVTLFAIAMAFLETAVVVYLRKLYYPGGFCFPLKMIDTDVAVTEFLREIATLIMLAGIGILAGKRNMERFAYFIFAFAVWDIFYYIFLELLLGWPASFLTRDVLFLVPFTWVGPVIAPVLNSLTMILLAGLIIRFTAKNGKCISRWPEWVLLIAGSLVMIAGYTEDYVSFMLQRFRWAELLGVSSNKDLLNYACTFVPDVFKWWIFLIGELMHLAAIVLLWLRNRGKMQGLRLL
jgi:hypothetical protein